MDTYHSILFVIFFKYLVVTSKFFLYLTRNKKIKNHYIFQIISYHIINSITLLNIFTSFKHI